MICRKVTIFFFDLAKWNAFADKVYCFIESANFICELKNRMRIKKDLCLLCVKTESSQFSNCYINKFSN